MWVNPTTYSDYSKLVSLIPIVEKDIKFWLLKNDPIINTEPVYEEKVNSQESYAEINPDGTITAFNLSMFTEPTPDPTKNPEQYKHRKDWRFVVGFHEQKWNKDILKESSETLSTLNGLRQLQINFLCPFGKIAHHLDDWGENIYGYSIVLTVQSGMNDSLSKLVGMRVNGVDKFPLAGELVCFDGIKNAHSIWNNTNIWRISVAFDIDIGAFNK